MLELLHHIADQGEHLRDWEVTRQADGVLLRVKSRECYASEADAGEAAVDLLDQVLAPGYQPVTEPVTAARSEERRGVPAWRASVEVVLAPAPAPPHLTGVPSAPAD